MSMLILTRTPGRIIVVGDDILVKILSVNGYQVRVGIQAPDDVQIHRLEIYEKMHGKRPDVF